MNGAGLGLALGIPGKKADKHADQDCQTPWYIRVHWLGIVFHLGYPHVVFLRRLIKLKAILSMDSLKGLEIRRVQLSEGQKNPGDLGVISEARADSKVRGSRLTTIDTSRNSPVSSHREQRGSPALLYFFLHVPTP